MKACVWSCLVVGVFLYAAAVTRAQAPVGALAIDERQGSRYGWAVDYETPAAARAAALDECGPGCSVALTFNRCGAYAADQDADSTAVGWAQSYDSADGARQAALAECRSRGAGSGCIVRAWGCNGPVAEEGLNLDRSARREIQQGLQAGGFDPGGADGLFGPRTRAAIHGWQSARGARTTGYLDAAQVEALRGTARSRPLAAASPPQPAATAEQETVFWQSIANSTDPADFEAYLRRFPNGVFSDLAQNRLAAMRGPADSPPANAAAGGIGAPASGPRISESAARASGSAAGDDVRQRPGTVSHSDPTCAGQPAGAACWMAISQRTGCHVWNPGLAPGATVTWTGECAGGFAQGMGTLAWVWDGNRQTATGRLEDGRRNGHWVFRFPSGDVQEGPMADDVRNGHWILRYADGNVWEGPNVNGERHGRWVIRYADGTVGEGAFVDGNADGTWILRGADGTVEERLFRDGERVR